MSNLSDEELTKMAVASLISDAKKFKERHERSEQPQPREAPKNLNTGFLRRLIANNESHNQRMETNRSNKPATTFASKYKRGRSEKRSYRRKLSSSSSTSPDNKSKKGKRYSTSSSESSDSNSSRSSSSDSSSSDSSSSDSSSSNSSSSNSSSSSSSSASFVTCSEDESASKKRRGDILDGVNSKRKRVHSSSHQDN